MAITKNSATLICQGGTTGAGGAASCRLWLLACTEAPAAIETANALDIFLGHMQKGDVIIASTTRDGTPVGTMYIVTAATAAIVIAPFRDNVT